MGISGVSSLMVRLPDS